MARNAKTFVGHITDATKTLLRWGELTGLIGGLLGGGGLFGIDRLAIGAGNSRRSAMGLGVTPGEEKAFDVNYGRLVDPNRFLENINTAKTDVRSNQFLALNASGISSADIQNKNNADLAIESVQALKRLVDKTPLGPMFAPTMSAYRADSVMSLSELQRLKATPANEVAGYGKQYQTDVKALDLTTQQQKAWQDLQVQMHRAGEEIETTFIRGLTPLAPQLEKLSSAFTGLVSSFLQSPQVKAWIDDLAEGLGAFAKFIGTPQFAADVESFTSKVGALARSIGSAFEYAASWVIPDDKSKQAAATPGTSLNKSETAPGESGWGFTPGLGFHWTPLTEPRGVRNNNPLNLSYAPGQGAVGSDGRFGVYDTPEAGFAASERQLLRYQAGGVGTLSGVINKWAPASDGNDTNSYIASVSRGTGLAPDAPLDFRNRETAAAVVAEMARHETGRRFDPEVVQRGVDQGLSGQQLARAATALEALARAQKPGGASVTVMNQTGGNAVVSASQLAH